MNDLLTIFKALSDETRLRILKLLGPGELCVCRIVAALGMVQPKVSFHLGVLKDAGLVRDRKDGKWAHYRLDETDAFKRFLIFSVLEKIPEATTVEDIARLNKWLHQKEAAAVKACCPASTKKSFHARSVAK